MYLFQKIIMASEDVQSYVRSGRFYDGEEVADVQTGSIVVAGDAEPHEVYANTPDLNVRKVEAPKAVTDKVSIVDYVGVSEADVVNVRYKVGSKTWGYPAPAGTVVRYRTPKYEDMFWLGADNFVSEPTVNQYATVTAGDTRLTPVAAPVAGQFCVKIEQVANIITGMVNNGVKYRCYVVSEAQ